MAAVSDKISIRNEYLIRRQKLTPQEAGYAAGQINQTLMATLPKEGCIAAYLSIKGEVDILPAMTAFAARGQQTCLPVVEKRGMSLHFRLWRPGQALVMGLHQVRVPQDGAEIVPDILLVPLVAFDKKGHRLGYGAGYYDQTLQKLRAGREKLLVIGVAYALQQVYELPSEPHDERLDKVVTEQGVIEFS